MLFCRKFGNVVNRAFLVLILWVKKLVGANFTRFFPTMGIWYFGISQRCEVGSNYLVMTAEIFGPVLSQLYFCFSFFFWYFNLKPLFILQT